MFGNVDTLAEVAHRLSISSQVLTDGVSMYAGQAMALVLADTLENAVKMAAAVSASYEVIDKPILTVQEAIEKNSFFDSPGPADVVKIGDAEGSYMYMCTCTFTVYIQMH